MKKYTITYTDTIEARNKKDAQLMLLSDVILMAEYQDIHRFKVRLKDTGTVVIK